MDRFTAALISKYTLKIPPKDDWFAPLVGNWDIRCVDAMRWETKGEWFSAGCWTDRHRGFAHLPRHES